MEVHSIDRLKPLIETYVWAASLLYTSSDPKFIEALNLAQYHQDSPVIQTIKKYSEFFQENFNPTSYYQQLDQSQNASFSQELNKISPIAQLIYVTLTL